ncbi:MAG: hypothetical protein L3J71_02485 [Victivallaceae bacterium]|nr:hypothetical protein [Victivallaceae bacterium]
MSVFTRFDNHRETRIAAIMNQPSYLFGYSVDWDVDTPAGLASKTTGDVKVFGRFFAFPMSAADVITLNETAALVEAQDAALLVTLEPWSGLTSVTAAEADRHALIFQNTGVNIFIRFGHEMNGSWFPWGQKPTEFKAAFNIMSNAVKALGSTKTQMVFAPTYASGYPFTGGTYAALPGSPEYAVLDTNSDGVLDIYDDPYGPYYPGDDTVDWVALTIFHWGSVYPWTENEIPEAGKFAEQITGTYNGFSGDETMIPNFYQIYAVDKGKKMLIPETSALFIPSLGPADIESQIKTEWWNQLFSPASRAQFPEIKMILWFEWVKTEPSAGGNVVDWRITTISEVI